MSVRYQNRSPKVKPLSGLGEICAEHLNKGYFFYETG